MELKLNGKVKLISDLQSWDSGFTKREFVITTNEQYPQMKLNTKNIKSFMSKCHI